jgi:hypothetical protein
LISKYQILFLISVLVVTVLSCENTLKGDFNENQLPKTFLTVDKIDREGDFRLSSQINISWWGNDPDGYIVGYEYAINDTSEGSWTFTRRTDSTFILPITQGQIQDDVLFKIRAVDNNDARDPIGAKLVFPIVNTAPNVSINQTEIPPDTLFSIASFGWTINDPDGLANLIRTEVAVNSKTDGWVEIPFSLEEDGRLFISLEVDNTTTGEKEAEVFLGRSYTRALNNANEPLTVPNLVVDSQNTFYVRTIDAAGAESNIDSVSWYIKGQYSSVLFINDDGTSNSLTKQAEHFFYLDEIGIQPDLWLINTGTVSQDKIALSDQFPSVVDPTLKKTLAKWDHIYWVSNNIDRNITYAQEITSEFFDAGGTMFVNIPMKGISQSDPIFNFIPVDSIGRTTEGSIETGFVLNADVDVEPEPGISSVVAKTEVRQVGVVPIKPVPGGTMLYQADFRNTTLIGITLDYTRFEGVGVENPEKDLIYFSLDLTNINGNSNLPDLLNDMLIGRLNFKP